MMNPSDVRTREDLARFIRELVADLEHRPDEWENGDLPSYLEAASAWIDDMSGYYKNRGLTVPEQPDWSTLAEIFAAAKIYE